MDAGSLMASTYHYPARQQSAVLVTRPIGQILSQTHFTSIANNGENE
jgi:hypothetical protein